MQIQTHILTAAAIGVAFAPTAAGMLACMAGGITPDRLDGFFSFRNRRRWERIHRTWSHNLGYWLIPVIIWIAFWPYDFTGVKRLLYDCALFFYIGLLSHLVLDFLNPTGIGVVPFMSRQRIGASIVRTGSAGDKLVGAALLFMGILWRVHEGLNVKQFFFFGKF